MTYRYYTIGVIAALKQSIIEKFGADCLSASYRRIEAPPGVSLVECPVFADHTDDELQAPSVYDPSTLPPAPDVARLQRWGWQDRSRPWRPIHTVRVGVAPRARVLVWGE